MSDQNKLALLCILIVVAAAIWIHPGGVDSSTSGEDIFQKTQANQESPFSDNPKTSSTYESNKKLLSKTAEGDFQGSPFD